jgi:hypothetical protein
VQTPLIGGWLRKQVKKYGEGTLELTKVHQEPYPSPDHFQPWETCMTMGGSWGYNPKETNWKAPKQLVQNLVHVVSRGGNYLLNVGPTPRGVFPPEAVERLQYVGKWMKTYNKSIYGATYTPMQGQAWGQATRNGGKIYLHISDWPADGKLVVENFPGAARTVSLFAGKPLTFSQGGTRLEIALPAAGPDPDVSVLTVEIDSAEKCWSDYSAPVPTTVEPKKYVQDQAKSSFIINAVLNGAIAFCAYSFYQHFSYYEVAKDILTTVFVITFLTAWIMVGAARGEYKKGNIAIHPTKRRGLRLPKSSFLRGLLIGIACTIVWGGLLSGFAYLVSPAGMNNWVYAFFKTIFTGLSGALASALTVLSVIGDENRS